MFLYSIFYLLCGFGLAASLVLWACGAWFCLFVASVGFRCWTARLLGGSGLRGAHGNLGKRGRGGTGPGERPRHLRMRGQGGQIFIINMYCSNTFRIFVFLAFHMFMEDVYFLVEGVRSTTFFHCELLKAVRHWISCWCSCRIGFFKGFIFDWFVSLWPAHSSICWDIIFFKVVIFVRSVRCA